LVEIEDPVGIHNESLIRRVESIDTLIPITDDGYNWEALRNAAANSAKPEEQVQLMVEYLAEYWAEAKE